MRTKVSFVGFVAILIAFNCLDMGQVPASTPGTFGRGSGVAFSKWPVTEWKDCNLRISFPGQPKYSLRFTTSFERKLADHYFVYEDSNESYSVECGEHPYIVDDTETLNDVYEQWLKASGTNPEYESPVGSPINILGHPGRQLEFGRMHGTIFVRTWFVVVGENRYQFQFVARKPSLSKELSSSQRNLMNRFFDSLDLLESRDIVNKKFPESLPSNLQGTLRIGEYVNSFFDFSMALPLDWFLISNEQFEAFHREGHQLSGNRVSEKDESRTRVLVALSKSPPGKSPFAFLTIGAEKQRWKFITQKAVTEGNRDTVLNLPNIKSRLVRDVTDENLGKTVFSTVNIDIVVGEQTIHQKSYVLLSKGFSLVFQLQYIDDAERVEMERSLASLKFGAAS
jgi:hypothetical protein